MSTPSLQKIEENLDLVGADIWRYDGPDLDFDNMLQRLSRLQTQLKVQRRLYTTAELLRQQSGNTSLPKQQATRVKHFLKFVFEHTTRGNERHIRLRKLDCNALKFCGLSYKIKDIIEMPETKFDFIVEKVEDFAHRRKLAEYLYRNDIDKAVYSKLDPEDDDIFREFMKSHIERRPAKRKRLESAQPQDMTRRIATASPCTPADDIIQSTQKIQGLERATALQGQQVDPSKLDESIKERSEDSIRARATSQEIPGTLTIPGYCPFVFTTREIINKLPEPFRTGAMTSSQWNKDPGGPAATNCLSLYMPKVEDDVFILIRVGYNSGWNICDRFGFGEDLF